MKKVIVSLAVVASFVLATDSHAATASANGTAEVMTPIAISKTADLRFGKFSALSGGTVVIAANGARTKTGAVVLSTATAGGAASFTVTGDVAAYAVTLPSTATITHTDTIQTMTIGTFTSDTTGTITGGSVTLNVGGTLTVGNAQPSGSYTGTFDVSVEYN